MSDEMRKRNIILIALTVIILAVLAYGYCYVSDYYHADSDVKSNLGNVNVINTTNGLLLDGPGNGTAVIFYPGAKVEYTSYMPMLAELAKRGVDSYIVEMPLNIAFLGANSADEIIEGGNYSHYFIAGHSLGGVAASSYVNDTNKTDGLILLASYPTSKIEKPVLSIYGSNDLILNMEEYDKSKPLMDNLTEVIIKGGNHAQVGNYENQTGDGIAEITPESQQSRSVNSIVEFIEKIV